MTPGDLQKTLMNLYAPQLTSKEVTVEVQSSSFPVYVTGAVLRPGKIASDHPITALEAIMEAGGPDYTKANLKNVSVIRQEGNQTKNYNLNLKRVDGRKERRAVLPEALRHHLRAGKILLVLNPVAREAPPRPWFNRQSRFRTRPGGWYKLNPDAEEESLLSW